MPFSRGSVPVRDPTGNSQAPMLVPRPVAIPALSTGLPFHRDIELPSSGNVTKSSASPVLYTVSLWPAWELRNEACFVSDEVRHVWGRCPFAPRRRVGDIASWMSFANSIYESSVWPRCGIELWGRRKEDSSSVPWGWTFPDNARALILTPLRCPHTLTFISTDYHISLSDLCPYHLFPWKQEAL